MGAHCILMFVQQSAIHASREYRNVDDVNHQWTVIPFDYRRSETANIVVRKLGDDSAADA